MHTPLQATEKYSARFPDITDPERQTYAAMLSAMDDAIGLVLTKLEETGKRDRTLVVFTNDNGGPTTRNAVNGSRNTPLRGSKCETFEGGIRVPLLMQWPGVIEPGTTYAKPVISFDISATALAAAGADATQIDGVDLLPFVTGEKAGGAARRALLAQPHDEQQLRCASGRLEVRPFDRRRLGSRPEPNAGSRQAVQPRRRHR